MKSIIQQGDYPVCYISGRSDHLEEHHVFGGINRKNSEKYGLKIYLTADKHKFKKDSIHMNRELSDRVKAEVQLIAMEHYDWTVEEFRLIFGKSYI